MAPGAHRASRRSQGRQARTPQTAAAHRRAYPRVARLAGTAVVAVVLTLVDPLVAHAQTSSASDPAATPTDFAANLVYSAGFDLGELNRPEIEEEDRYVDHWLVRYSATALPAWLQPIVRENGARLPEFMAPVLALGGSPTGDRYLRLRLRGADLLLTTRRDPAQPALVLAPSSRLRWRVLARWDDLGEGRWELLVRLANGDVLPLFEGRGAQVEWRPLSGELELPAGAERGDLELWLHGYRGGVRPGEVGLDSLELETLPRLALEWKESVARVSPIDEMPLVVRSHGLPMSRESYRIEYRIEDAAGRSLAAGEQPVLVLEGRAIEYTPRLHWRRWQLGRGVYSLRVRVHSPRGEQLEEQRTFMLAGPAPFARGLGPVEWGAESTVTASAPFWLDIIAPQRLLLQLTPSDLGESSTLAAWLDRRPEVLVSVAFAGQAWSPSLVATLGAWLVRYRQWYWAGDADEAQAFLPEVRTAAPFIQLGSQLAPDVVVPATDEPALVTLRPPSRSWHEWRAALSRAASPWAARLDRTLPLAAEPAAPGALAAAAYILASFGPRSVFLVDPAATLFDRQPSGELLPRRSLLAWEFVTAFLSAAEFVGYEDGESDLHALTFRRDGSEYLVVFTDGRVGEWLLLAGTAGRAWNELGDEVPLTIDAGGRVRLPIGPSPLVVQGLDLPRVRTLQSFAIRSAGLLRNASEQQLVLSVTNHYGVPLRATLEVELPRGWQVQQKLSPTRIAAGSTAEWPLGVHVPSYQGTGSVPRLVGKLLLQDESGFDVVLPIDQEIPLAASLVEIRTLGIGATDADVAIRNISGRTLTAHVYLSVRPNGSEVTRLRQTLPPDAELTFPITYPQGADGVGRRLMVSVSVPAERAYENRVFEIP